MWSVYFDVIEFEVYESGVYVDYGGNELGCYLWGCGEDFVVDCEGSYLSFWYICSNVGLYLSLCGCGVVGEKWNGFCFDVNNKFDVGVGEGFYDGFISVVDFDIVEGCGEE